MIRYFPPGSGYFVYLYLVCFVLVCNFFVSFKQVQEARRVFRQKRERLGCVDQMNEQLSETKMDMNRLDLRQRRV